MSTKVFPKSNMADKEHCVNLMILFLSNIIQGNRRRWLMMQRHWITLWQEEDSFWMFLSFLCYFCDHVIAHLPRSCRRLSRNTGGWDKVWNTYIYIKVSIFLRTILYICVCVYVGDINIRLLFSSTSMNNCLLYTTDQWIASDKKKKHFIWSNLGWKVITRARVQWISRVLVANQSAQNLDIHWFGIH